jgi:hypothetical protein
MVCAALFLGCAKQPDSPAADEEPALRAQFAELQEALKICDPEKLWILLASRSQADAERVANTIQAAYTKATAGNKAGLEKTLGLSGTDLTALTGRGYLKTKRFQEKYHELPGSTIERIVLEGKNAVVHYLESDGDKEKAVFVREDGQWKASLPMPRMMQP